MLYLEVYSGEKMLTQFECIAFSAATKCTKLPDDFMCYMTFTCVPNGFDIEDLQEKRRDYRVVTDGYSLFSAVGEAHIVHDESKLVIHIDSAEEFRKEQKEREG